MTSALAVRPDNIPAELRALKQWICWKEVERKGKFTKPPYRLDGTLGDSTTPAAWADFQDALEAYQHGSHGFTGIGFTFPADDAYAGVDLDHCRDPATDTIEPWALKIIRALDSYTEISPSGAGVHIIVKGHLPGNRRRLGLIEMYDTERYFTVTGHFVEGQPTTIAPRQNQLTAFYNATFSKKANSTPQPGSLDDATLLQKAKAAVNGAKFSRLYDGDTTGYPSQSEADLALCSHLAFWTDGDPARMDGLFRQSGLFRPKWDEKHGTQTYGELTVAKALEGVTEFYRPGKTSGNGAHPQGDGDAKAPAEGEHDTDLALARRLVALHGQDLRYCWPWGKWLAWNGQRWASDDCGQVVSRCKDAAKGIYADARIAYAAATEAAARGDTNTQTAAKTRADALYKWAVKSENTARLFAAIVSAQSEPGIPVLTSQLDANPWLLNCVNGTLDLKTGQLRPHRREDLITKLAPVEYYPTAKLELWDSFLDQAVPDAETRRYIQKAAGSCLTGEAPDDILLFVYGPGGSGKGTFSGAMQGVLGDYATTAEMSTFVTDRNSTGPRPDLAALRGSRMVVIEEIDDRQPGIIAMLKKASGGTPISTRSHRQETFTFVPQFKLWLLGNKRPPFQDDDSGLWRRMRLLEFTHVFTPPDPKVRKMLSTSTLAGSAVLAWAVEGCLLWQKEGLAEVPPAVLGATEKYRGDMNPLADWLDERTTASPNTWTPFKALFADYQFWCKENRVRELGRKTFGQRLSAQFLSQKAAQGIRGYDGIALKFGVGGISEMPLKAEVPVDSLIESFTREKQYSEMPQMPPLDTNQSYTPNATSNGAFPAPGGICGISSPQAPAAACVVCGLPVPNGGNKLYLPSGGVRHEACPPQAEPPP